MKRRTVTRMPPPAFIDHDLDYLRRYPNAAVVTPLGPDPLRVRLVLNSLIHKWIRHVAGLYPYHLRSHEDAYRNVIRCAILAGLPVLEARAAGAIR
jgi:hypothetical protein